MKTSNLPPPGGSLPPPGGLIASALSPCLSLCVVVLDVGGGISYSNVAYRAQLVSIRSLGRLPVGLGSSHEMPCHTFSLNVKSR